MDIGISSSISGVSPSHQRPIENPLQTKFYSLGYVSHNHYRTQNLGYHPVLIVETNRSAKFIIKSTISLNS